MTEKKIYATTRLFSKKNRKVQTSRLFREISGHVEVAWIHTIKLEYFNLSLGLTMISFKTRLERIYFNFDNLPEKFLDCVSLQLMEDPVTLSDGHIYDRATALALFALPAAQSISPKTRAPLNPQVMIEAHDFRSQIIDFVEQQERIAAPFMAVIEHQKQEHKAEMAAQKRLHDLELEILDMKYRKLGDKYQGLKEGSSQSSGWLGWLWSNPIDADKRSAEEDVEDPSLKKKPKKDPKPN